MSNIIIVHGEKLDRKGQMRKEFIARLNMAVELAAGLNEVTVVISGGETRKGFATEAKLGHDYLADKLQHPVLLEDQARTTVENVKYSKKLLESRKREKLFVISSLRRMPRIRLLYFTHWAEVQGLIEFVGAADYYFFTFSLLEKLYTLVARLDPHEKTLGRISKKLFRNKYEN